MIDVRRTEGSADEDDRACAELLRRGSKSFHAASRLLPARLRAPTHALYAFCRVADDLVDGQANEHGAPRPASDPTKAVDRLEARLDAVYAGRPANAPVDRAFARVVERFALPRALPAALLDGMRWDAEGRRVDDEAALLGYSARVASAVGVMMTVLMGERRPTLLARACDLGVAMQLTNIARDVGEDARIGRVYLPTRWLSEAGVERDAWLARPVHDERLASVVMRVLDRADALYARADAGIAELPADCRRSIYAARRIYAAIGSVVARRRFDAVSRRAVVSRPKKIWLLARALWGPLPKPDPEALALPPLDETRFLIAGAS